MTDPDTNENAQNDLVGVKGLLKSYAILLILGIVQLLMFAAILFDSGSPIAAYMTVYQLILVIIGLYLICSVRKRITRTYHLLLLIILAGIKAFNAVEIQDWAVVVAALAWASYWFLSKRVWATYCQDTGQND